MRHGNQQIGWNANQVYFRNFEDEHYIYDLLWSKLHLKGISTKFLISIKHFYVNGCATIRTKEAFSIFISDLANVFQSQGCREISVKRIVEILILVFTDELMLLFDTLIELSRKSKVLRLYCIQKALKVITKKTKIVIFRRGGNVSGGGSDPGNN